MRAFLKIYITEVIQKKRKGLFPTFLRGLCFLLSFPYAFCTNLRNWGFNKGYLKSHSYPNCLIISVGNIVAGGAGKTPVTLMLAQALLPHTKVGIISRGYHSELENQSPVIINDKQGLKFSPQHCGDEPYLLAQRCPNATVVVGKDRYKAVKVALNTGVKTIVLDDAFQHRQLTRHIDIVVLNAHDLFGQGYLLPHGLLRESLNSLKRANLIILNHVTSLLHSEELIKKIKKYSNSPIICTRMHVSGVKNLKDNSLLNIEGQRVGGFCGIAHPHLFFQTVTNLGANLILQRHFPDHHRYRHNELAAMSDQCKKAGATLLLCTEKDAVKIKEFPLSLPIGYVQIDLEILSGHEHWTYLINQAKEYGKNLKL